MSPISAPSAPFDEDIYGAQSSVFGVISTSNFAIDASTIDNRNPSVSGSLFSSSYVIAYEEAPTTAGDIYASVFFGNSPSLAANLTTLEGVNTGAARRLPSVDNNADRFVVAVSEAFNSADYDRYISTYCLGTNIRVAEQHRNLDFTNPNTVIARVTSTYGANGAFPGEFLAVWDLRGALGGGVIEGGYTTAASTCCIHDVTRDGQTDVSDLLVVITAWGPCADLSICPATSTATASSM